MFDLLGGRVAMYSCTGSTLPKGAWPRRQDESEILLLYLSCHSAVLPGVRLHQPKKRGTSMDSHRGDV